ncbi:MAG TPA: hypothetical protein VGR14_02850 [Verrucomicrobiae bacterium]|jgi:hypothetical protein|nr:hypothetical protein [Verrucomicrobiae bacterium]
MKRDTKQVRRNRKSSTVNKQTQSQSAKSPWRTPKTLGSFAEWSVEVTNEIKRLIATEKSKVVKIKLQHLGRMVENLILGGRVDQITASDSSIGGDQFDAIVSDPLHFLTESVSAAVGLLDLMAIKIGAMEDLMEEADAERGKPSASLIDCGVVNLAWDCGIALAERMEKVGEAVASVRPQPAKPAPALAGAEKGGAR